MYLHIVPDNTFINKFYENLQELSLIDRNKIVVRSNDAKLKSIKYNLPFAPIYSRQFESFVGDTSQYDKVFIHYFTPLLYRFVATHQFRELNWMIWGGDLYNLPALDKLCYEPQTLSHYIKTDWSAQTKLYELKVFFTQQPFASKAYSKGKNILTWMDQEYRFAVDHLPVKANLKFFFYENQMPYAKLDSLVVTDTAPGSLSFIVGNSGSPTNNHLDVVQFLEDNKVQANLFIPVSYGDARYISFLKKKLKFSQGKIEFIDRYMPFEEYLNFLKSSDGLIMNTVRPQGYGNILMMMYLGKPVFFNKKNISLPDLDAAMLKWMPIESLRSFQKATVENKNAVVDLLSHDRLLKEYSKLFS
jgi:dTDP-N-acetylfucosamine:lipid II N-acetylfucosaminyltransferase